MAGTAPLIPGCRDLSLIGERVARSLFAATSDRVGRPVTVTVFPPLSEGRTREQFDRAAATAQRLGVHPSVVTIHEWGHASDGRPWVVTDPQPAESVDTLLTMDGPLEVERALQVGVLLAGALETAHRAGIVHGDLSPARLVFGTHGEPLLAETGLAPFAVLPGLGALNNPVRYYAPPEVLERTEISPATDVYSLATTVYALLAGRAPQQKPAEITDSNASLLLRILQMPVPRIERPGLPPGLEDALRGPLSPSPHKRPQQAIEMAWLLQDAQRRAGFAVTEPVVLDLDVTGSGAPASRRPGPMALAPTWPDEDEPAAPPTSGTPGWGPAVATQGSGAPPTSPALPSLAPTSAPPFPAVPPVTALTPPSPPSGRPHAVPAPSPPAVPPLPSVAAAGLSGSSAGAQVDDPLPADMFAFSEPEPPSPTIFPFSDEPDGLGIPSPADRPALSGAPSAPERPPADPSPWSVPGAGAAPTGALWPSTWPSDTDPSPPGSTGAPPWGSAPPSAAAQVAASPVAPPEPREREGIDEPPTPLVDAGDDTPWATDEPGSTVADASLAAAPDGSTTAGQTDRAADGIPWPTGAEASPPLAGVPGTDPESHAAGEGADPPPRAPSGDPTGVDPGGAAPGGPLPAPVAWADTRWPDEQAHADPEPGAWPAPPTSGPAAAGDRADTRGASTPSSGSPDAAWPAASGGDDSGRSLWPSTWPTDAEQAAAAAATPSWATPPPDGDAPDAGRPRPGAGGDGGSIGDLTTLPSIGGTGNGNDPAADVPYFPPIVPPPELDELPAWYTDPLPNTPDRPGGDGAVAGSGPGWPGSSEEGPGPGPAQAPGTGGPGPGANGNGDPRTPPGSASTGLPAPPLASPNGNGANGAGGDLMHGGTGLAATPWNGSSGGNGRSTGGAERLPGAGDELRSLFGEVVRDPDDTPPVAPPRPAPPMQVRPLPDPLGPPDARPPIDMSALDAPLGPAPFLGAPSAGDGTPPDAPTARAAPRLPRRDEVAPQAGATVTRLPRAGEMPVAPLGTRPAATPGAAASGPPALPLIILIAVVAILVAGVAWLVLTGDEAAPPASEREPSGAEEPVAGDSDGSAAGEGGATTGTPDAPTDGAASPAGGDSTATGASTAPANVQATAGPDGVQVSWEGTGDAFNVTVLTPDQPPATIPATGTSALVPSDSLGANGTWCVTVAAAPAGGPPGPASAPVCSPGATVEGMRGA